MLSRFCRAARRPGPAAIALAILASGAGLTAGGGEPAAEPRVFQLEAADGVSAAFLVPLEVERDGPLRIAVRWTGRGLAWVELRDEAGRELFHRSGSSPIEFALDVPRRVAARHPEWTIRFRTAVARGELRGLVEIRWPAETVPGRPSAAAAVARPLPGPGGRAAIAWRGPAACLAEAARGDSDAARALRRLGDAVERAGDEGRAWARRWASAVSSLDRQEREDGSLPRRRLDRLWRALRLEPVPDPDVAAGVRAVLAATEDLVRREETAQAAKLRGRLRAQRRELLASLSCLVEQEPSATE